MTYDEREALYAKLAAAATLIHETYYRLRGDRYATEAEMEMIRRDPLAYDDQIQEMLILATGYRTKNGAIEQATAHEIRWAAQDAVKGWTYIADQIDTATRSRRVSQE